MTAAHASCDTALARCRNKAGADARYPRLVIATTTLASSLAFVDGSVVNVALPAIGESLGTDARGVQWVVNAYLLPLGALLLLGGAAGDRFGARRLLILGVAIFGVSSIACAAAPNLATLLAARFIQGVSAAMLLPASLAILGQRFSGAAKGRAVGIWAAAGAIGGAIGPVLGGWLIDIGSWRLIFLMNIPLAAAAMALAYLYVDEDSDEGARRLDVLGGALATGGLGLVTFALTEGSGRSWSISALAALAAGALLLTVFVFVERQRGERAMMPLALFGSARFVGLTVLTFLLYASLSGLFVVVPYVLIVADGYSATQAGAALLPLPIALGLLSPAAGALAAKIGPRRPLIIGSIVVAIGFLLAVRIGFDSSFWSGVLPGMTVVALGMAIAVAPLTTAVLASVDSDHVGAASGMNSAVARVGGLVATALVGAVMVSSGSALASAVAVAAVAAAVFCFGAALSAYLLISDVSQSAVKD